MTKIISTGLLLAAAMAASGIASAQTTKFRAWNIHPDGYPVTDAMKSFASEIERTTGGRYQVEVHSNAVLGDQPKAVQMLKAGEIELAEFGLAPLSEGAPTTKSLNLPFLFGDSKAMFQLLDGETGKTFEDRLKASGYVVLGWYDGGARSFYCTSKKIQNVEDFKGLNIRVQNTEIYNEMIKSLGAVPKAIPYKDTLAALEKGEIDCAENNMPSFVSAGHYKVAKHVFLTNHVISPEALVVSTRVWDKLSPADQQAFKTAGMKSALLMRALWNKKVDESREIASKAGVQFTRMTNVSPLMRRMQGMHGKYMADPQTRDELIKIVAAGTKG